MTRADLVGNFLVRVSDASGVIVCPLDDKLLYAFTCYHVIKGKDLGDINICFHELSHLKDYVLKPLKVIVDEEKDIAIIQIENQIHYDLFLRPSLDKNSSECFHLGFPKCRQNINPEDNVPPFMVLGIKKINFEVGKGCIEYEYERSPLKQEIEGMSGGGIFNSNNDLIGIHTQNSNHDKLEILGNAQMIPISSYLKVLSENLCSPVLQFDLQSFSSFIGNVFNLNDDSFLEQRISDILCNIDQYSKQVSYWAPFRVISLINESYGIKLNIADFSNEYWISFTDFVVGLSLLLDIHGQETDFIKSIFPRFGYYYSQKSFHVFNARNELDLNAVKFVCRNGYLFVGGLKHSSISGSMLPNSTRVPDIAAPQTFSENDILISNRRLLGQFNIVDNYIFNIAAYHCAEQSMCLFEEYRNLLLTKIGVTENARSQTY